jgi:hypothetical protein
VEAPKNIWNPKTGILTKLACLKTNGTLYANLVTWNKRLSSGLFGFFCGTSAHPSESLTELICLVFLDI